MNEKLDTRQILVRTILTVLPTFAFFVLAISGFDLLSKMFWATIMTLFTALLFVQSLLAGREREKQLDQAKSVMLNHFNHYIEDGYELDSIHAHLVHWLNTMRENNQITLYEYHQLQVFLSQIYSTATSTSIHYRKEFETLNRRRKNLSIQDDDNSSDLTTGDNTTTNQQESS